MRRYSPNISSIFMEHKILTMNLYCRWNSVLVVAFIVQLFAFSGIKAANWNKKRTKRCILPISMLPDLNAEHLYFAPGPLSLFKMGGFYGNIIEPSDQTSFAQTIVIMTSQLFHLSHNHQLLHQSWLIFETNRVFCHDWVKLRSDLLRMGFDAEITQQIALKPWKHKWQK